MGQGRARGMGGQIRGGFAFGCEMAPFDPRARFDPFVAGI